MTVLENHINDLTTLLIEVSREQLADPEFAASKSEDRVRSAWLGERGASEDEIASAEQRIGVRLPPSYRAFLSISNGFDDIGPFIYRLYSTAEIDWFSERNKGWIDAYQEGLEGGNDISAEEHLSNPKDSVRFRRAYLSRCLQISDVGDSAVVLLNPEVVNSEGEWETWLFANWYPGAERYPSFRAYIEHELESIKRLRLD